jgi:hypothetical protein
MIRGLVDSDDVCGAVAAGAADLVAGPAGHVRQADRPGVGADLFAGLPDRCRGGWLARVHGAAGDIPAVVVAGMAGRQHPACPAAGQDRHRRYGQQLMPGNGPQPGCMRGGTRLGKTRRPGGRASSPGYRALAASLALMVPAPACSQRAEVPPGEQPAVRASAISMHEAEYSLALS